MDDERPAAAITDEPALDGATRQVVEGLLAAAWADPVHVVAATLVEERWHVVRVETADGRTAIVKRVRRTDDDPRSVGAAGLAMDAASLEHLSAMTEPVAPRVLGGDRAHGVLVIEELPPGRTLADSLLGPDPAVARADVVAYAEALGALGAWSLGRTAAFADARRRHGVEDVRMWWPDRMAASAGRFADLLAAHGVDPAGVASDVDDVVATLTTGPHVGFAHGDPCPDNVRIVDGRCRVYDFERSGAASIALDAAYLLAPFPSCWCFGRLPVAVAREASAAHRSVLARAGVPLGDEWSRALAAALAGWLVARVAPLSDAIRGDDEWGTTTWRPRFLHWLAACTDEPGSGSVSVVDADVVAAGRASFPHLGRALSGLHRVLRDAWGDVAVPGYPAFGG